MIFFNIRTSYIYMIYTDIYDIYMHIYNIYDTRMIRVFVCISILIHQKKY